MPVQSKAEGSPLPELAGWRIILLILGRGDAMSFLDEFMRAKKMRVLFARAKRRRQRGYASFIGLLIVLVIIYYLVDTGYMKKNPQTGKSQAESYIDKGKDTACLQNLRTIEDNLTSSMMENGTLPSANVLRAKLEGQYRCPGDGTYQIDEQGHAYCTEHSPCSESLEASVINLE